MKTQRSKRWGVSLAMGLDCVIAIAVGQFASVGVVGFGLTFAGLFIVSSVILRFVFGVPWSEISRNRVADRLTRRELDS